jgi:hypoxanthine phosphoribosyltransferase
MQERSPSPRDRGRHTDRVAKLARRISKDYEGSKASPFSESSGRFIFLADLSRQLTIPRRVDFIALSSYESESTSAGAVWFILACAPRSKAHVLVVEDIVDTGLTSTTS